MLRRREERKKSSARQEVEFDATFQIVIEIWDETSPQDGLKRWVKKADIGGALQ